MVTVVTTTTLRRGAEEAWDSAMRERFDSARGRPGWVEGQLLTADARPHVRVIVGTWRSREDWEAWHHDPAFLDRRTALEDLEAEPSRVEWFTVVTHARAEV
jgi:heme-degrading monooxygenase HmoA